MNESCYLCIDLKSFYASVECVERGLDPLKAKLVVADPERGDNTICLAVTPTLKKMGVKNRCRIFQIPPTIEYIKACLLYTSPSPRDRQKSRMPSSA